MNYLLQELTDLRNELAALDHRVEKLDIAERGEAGRMLDSIAETAAVLRGNVDHGAGTRRARAFVRRVRKALGYSYP